MSPTALQSDTAAGRPLLTIPNILSTLRILIAPLLIVVAYLGGDRLFLALYVASLVTDGTDGFIARKLHQESPLGARLDSIGDLAICSSLPLSAYLLWPELVRREIPYVAACFACYLLPVVTGIFRYGRMPSFHTWGAKTVAIVMSAALVTMFATQYTLFFRLCLPLLIVESIEEVTMIALLPQWHPNVPSLWHALRIRREWQAAGRR